MKVALIILAAFTTLTTQKSNDTQKDKVAQFRSQCIKETEVNPDLIDKADKGDFVDDDKLKCFAKCFYQKAGFVNDKGELLIDVIKEKIQQHSHPEQALNVIEKCKDNRGADACETVYLIHKCYFEGTLAEEN